MPRTILILASLIFATASSAEPIAPTADSPFAVDSRAAVDVGDAALRWRQGGTTVQIYGSLDLGVSGGSSE